MDVPLRPDVERLIAEEIAAGRASDPAEFLSRAVEQFIISQEFERKFDPATIRQKIAVGLNQADRGQSIEGSEAFRDLRAHASAKQRKKV